jgi:hypothetical protein
VCLALIAATDLVSLVTDLWHTHAGGAVHPLAPRLLVALGGRPLPLLLLALVGLSALALLALGRRQIASGAAALAVLAVLAECQAALAGGPHRVYFAVGAVLLGWLGGLAWGRALSRGAVREDLAEAGAIAVLAATYVGAAVSKLLAHGFSWADESTLRSVLLSQNRVTEHGLLARYATLVIEHPGLSQALALAALLIQLGAFLYLLSPALRVLMGTLLLSFHLNVALLTGINYRANFFLLLLFSYPWPRRWPTREAAPLPARDPVVERRVLIAASVIVVVLVALAWLLPLRAYTQLHHRPS